MTKLLTRLLLELNSNSLTANANILFRILCRLYLLYGFLVWGILLNQLDLINKLNSYYINHL